MNPDGTVEYNSLSWVKKQLDAVLLDARNSLTEYIENPEEKSALEQCIDHIRLVCGTLQMVEVYGASMLAEEMELTAKAQLEGKVDNADDAFDVLMRAMLQLPDYLEGLQSGNKDTPIVLMPLMNDLRAARKEKLLSESILFLNDIESVQVDSLDIDISAIEGGKLGSEAKRLRTHYQLGLLDVLRNNKEQAGLQRMLAVIESLEKVSADASVRRFWAVIGALIEALLDEGVDNSISVKMLLGAVDRQIKLLINTDEDEFVDRYSQEVLKNILYYVGKSKSQGRRVTNIKNAYKLDELLPSETDISEIGASMGGFNAELFGTVSLGIREDLTAVKDTLEIFMHSDEKNIEQISSLTEQLEKIGDTYGMLGMGAVRQKVLDQRGQIEKIINGSLEPSEQCVMDIAGELLAAEAELDNYIAERSGLKDSGIGGEDRAIPASEYRKVLNTVIEEALQNFTEAKDAILSLAVGIGDREQLRIILQRLEEVRGAAMMLSVERIEKMLSNLMKYVRVAFVEHNRQPESEEQDTLADAVTSVEYYLESVAEGRPGVDIGLQAGEAAIAKLLEVLKQYDGVEPAYSLDDTEGEQAEVADLSTGEAKEQVQESGQQTVARIEPAHAAVIAEAIQEDYEILGDDADEEIVEIFIEEGVEVLETLNEFLPKWKADHDDEEALAVVRRSFHTLKGSGRLIGAMLIGEFSWKFESMLNRIIDKKITVNNEIFALLEEALSVLPQLIEQLKGNREPIPNINQMMMAAEAFSEGRSPGEAPAQAQQPQPGSADEPEAVMAPEPDAELDSLNDVDEDEELVISLLDEEGEQDSDDMEALLDLTDEIGVTGTEEISAGSEATGLDDINLLDEDDLVISIAGDDDQGLEENIELNEEGSGSTDSEMIDLSSDELLNDLEDFDSTGGNDEDNITISLDDSEMIDLSDDAIMMQLGDSETPGNDEDNIVLEPNDLDSIDVSGGAGELQMDPMLFQIYYDESNSHLNVIKDILVKHDSGEHGMEADKNMIRAFHTLFGSARTAEIEPIAELCGATEKYIKAREESGDISITDDAVEIIRDVSVCVSRMLEDIKNGNMPKPDAGLLDNINSLVQRTLQEQAQQASNELITPSDVEKHEEKSTKKKLIPEPIEETTVSYDDVDDDLIDIFLEEAEELLEDCESNMERFQENVDDISCINELQRHMHTLKGGARMASLTPVGDLTHVLESLVVELSEEKLEADKEVFAVLHESLDALNNMLEHVKTRKPLKTAGKLVSRIESIMRGEAASQGVIELETMEESSVDDDVSLLLSDEDDTAQPDRREGVDEPSQDDEGELLKRRSSDKEAEKPHWGERATDVNYKDSQEQIRVRADLLNNLVNYAGEVNIHHARMGKQITDIGFNLKELNQTVIRLKEQLRKLEIETEIQIRSSYEKEVGDDDYDEDFDPLEMDKYSTLQQLTRSLAETASDVESIKDFLAEIVSDSETLLMQESRISTDLQEGLMRTRMVRFGGMSTRLRRIIRQTARELNKEVEVEILGEENEVDRTILDRVVAPLEHMLRNAVAHGIESPEERAKAGKRETGKITILIGRQGPDVILRVSDDGAGINADAIRAKAISQGLLDKDNKLTDHDVLQFILKSGFSTATEISQIAGRGVGMDVVDSEIKQLGGVLEIDTERGKGTTFKIRLPLTLAINQALLVSANEDLYAVPLASIEGVVRITGTDLQGFYDSGDLLYEFNGVEYELKHLGNLLTGVQPDYSDQGQLFPVLLVNVGDQHFALHVEDLHGRREIVVKPVGIQIGTVRGIAGATILADGRVVLILEMSALVVGESLFKQIVTEEVVEKREDKETVIMVVDDSITIRKVTARILERNGMKVMSATDGVDATNQLQEAVPDLMLLDIEMPRMDGFELATYMRNEERLKNVPIIMITSRTGAKHKERALEIGVDQYLGKPYQEEELMKNINALLDQAG